MGLVGGLGVLIYLYWPLLGVEIGYRYGLGKYKQLPQEAEVIENLATTSDSDYRIIIPKIGAEAKIVEDVSPFKESEYSQVLRDGVVAQAQGTKKAGGGEGSMSYIFAHSTSQEWSAVRKNPVFYLLGELKNDDKFYIKSEGKVLTYQVYDRKVVRASEVNYLSYSEPGNEVVILQTCWPIGTNWKRLLVFGKKL